VRRTRSGKRRIRHRSIPGDSSPRLKPGAFSPRFFVIKHINILDSYRIGRHEVVYRGGHVSKEEASGAIEDAKDFLGIANEFFGVG
jgi:hypothetical protein